MAVSREQEAPVALVPKRGSWGAGKGAEVRGGARSGACFYFRFVVRMRFALAPWAPSATQLLTIALTVNSTIR
ncbi:hypothetical protein OKW39_003785 [Paraburkholderia sp. MM6662-R1]